MKGTEVYNNNWDMLSKKKIEANSDKPYLESFYYYILTDTSYSGAYSYLINIAKFVNEYNIDDPRKIVLDYYTRYLSSIKDKSSSYRIVVYSALKKFSSFLFANGYCDDYMKFVKRPKFKEAQETKEKREKGFLTEEEINIFINKVKDRKGNPAWRSRDLAMTSIFLNTGIRCSALHKLDIDDIDLNDGAITVLEKGDIARKISISNKTIEYIKDWINYRDALGLKNENALFVSDRRKRMTRQTIYNIISKYGEVIEGKHITPHKMRSTYGTQLYNKTQDIYFVQECMGHANPKTTEMYIRGNKSNFAQKASDLMESFLV